MVVEPMSLIILVTLRKDIMQNYRIDVKEICGLMRLVAKHLPSTLLKNGIGNGKGKSCLSLYLFVWKNYYCVFLNHARVHFTQV